MLLRKYDDCFPFANIRPEQKNAIEFALNEFIDSNKKFVILQMGTGTGKSATGITIARYLQKLYELKQSTSYDGGTYILTTQKVLQEQYISDFGGSKGHLKLIKSSSAYTCKLYDDQEEKVSCGEIQKLLKSTAPCKILYKMCSSNDNPTLTKPPCTWHAAREDFLNSPEGITNYAWFLTSSMYAKSVAKRHLMVLDEGHNIDTMVANQIKISFSNVFYKTILKIKMPNANAGQERIYKWIVNEVRPELRTLIKKKNQELKEKEDDSTKALELTKNVEKLRKSLQKIEYFIEVYDPKKWVLDLSKTDKRGEKIYEFKPIFVGEYCNSSLFSYADRVLILSATILDQDVFCESIGVNKADTAFLKIPSPFPIQNRPIHYLPAGRMSRSSIDKTLPDMANIIQMILDQHPNEKGIIHTVNYNIAKYLIDYFGNKRMIFHTSENRDEAIAFHLKSKFPTILLSPSMTEGVDLSDDLSRFQILCKIPFPYLGDTATKKRMELNKSWYDYQTVKTIVQAFGRSIRNDSDHATSYILDADWELFYKRSKHMFPEEFAQSIL